MKQSEEKRHVHDGCPYRGTCKKDEKKCCYLISNHHCYLNTEHSERFI